MIWYLPQSSNINKHEFMPNEYPWQISFTYIDGFIEITQDTYDNLLNTIDLTGYNNRIQYETNLKQQTEQREFGLHLIPELIDLMGERNLTLAQNGANINVLSIAADNSSIKLLIETGALKTARGISGMLKIKYPTHADIYDHLIQDITNFLEEKGYE